MKLFTSELSNLIVPMLLSFIISIIFTPIVIKIAYHVNAIDIPKDDRRVHTKPIPRLGGLSIYVACMISLATFNKLPDNKLLGIIVGSTLIVFMGFIDDINPISAKNKLLVQIISAGILVYNNIRIISFSNPLSINSSPIILNEYISIILSIIWIVGITNTFNLIDGLDGLTTGIATISSLMLSYIAFINGRYEFTMITLIIVGACLGFLPYNFNPAKIFMGDTGSLFLGFMLSAISLDGTLKSATAITVLIPVCVLAIPIIDTVTSIIRRLCRGQSPFEADKEHIHHKLMKKGLGQKKTVLFLYLINSLFGITGILIINKRYIFAICLLLITIIILYMNIRQNK